MKNVLTNGWSFLIDFSSLKSIRFVVFRRWDAASHELQSHVISSRARRSDQTRKFFMERDRDRRSDAPAAKSSRRTYGFASSNVSRFNDDHSENLYRYKNISSDYMREMSPPRERPPSPRRRTPSVERRSPPRRRRPTSPSDSDDSDDVIIVKEPTETTPSRRRQARK